MPTSQPSLYNAERTAFMKGRVEDPVNSTGTKKFSGGSRAPREDEKIDPTSTACRRIALQQGRATGPPPWT